MSNATRTYHRRDLAQWQRLLAEQRQSGESQQVFCKARGIALSTFQSWKRRLGDSVAIPAGQADWVDVSDALTSGNGSGWDIELDLGGGVCLRLRRA